MRKFYHKIYLALGASREVEDLEVVERALELLVQLDVPVRRGQCESLITRVAVQPGRFGHDVLHEPAAFPAPREGPPALGQGREGDLEELVHPRDRRDKVLELELEHLQRVLQNGLEVGFAEGNELWKLSIFTHTASHRQLHPLFSPSCSSTAERICGWTRSESIFR